MWRDKQRISAFFEFRKRSGALEGRPLAFARAARPLPFVGARRPVPFAGARRPLPFAREVRAVPLERSVVRARFGSVLVALTGASSRVIRRLRGIVSSKAAVS